VDLTESGRRSKSSKNGPVQQRVTGAEIQLRTRDSPLDSGLQAPTGELDNRLEK